MRARGRVCLGRRLGDLAELVWVLREPDLAIIEHAPDMVADLPPVEPCADSPRGPPEASDVAAVRLLARARLLALASKTAAARTVALEGLQQARLRRDAEAELSALMVLALVAEQDEDADLAQSWLSEALTVAERTGDDEAATRALIGSHYVVGVMKRDFEGAALYLRLAQAKLEYLGHPASLSADLLSGQGDVAAMNGDTAGAVQAHLRALDLRRELHGEPSLPVARTLVSLGSDYAGGAQLEQAEVYFGRALEIGAETLGDQHPWIATTTSALANVQARLGNREGFERLARRAIDSMTQQLGRFHPRVAMMRSNYATGLLEFGDTRAAVDEFADIVAMLEPEHPDYHRIAGNTSYVWGRALLLADQPVRAATKLEVAIEHLTAHFGSLIASQDVYAAILVHLGQACLRIDGRHEEGTRHLATALEIAEGQGQLAGHPLFEQARRELDEAHGNTGNVPP